ncbi:Cyclophilin-like [Cohaesibacter marisflavi]|uniref:Cyclophilin-like n=1 Tax=Cohaesibacter marisflavi TaxID=655353 RepID=A0A1I5EWT3_9HYPH|nr:cyclophilin-like fold protein [Cohaesibacter marisflavi]SFO15982.1 Cyclophilin-like [Cohaesibacter marisflavi]
MLVIASVGTSGAKAEEGKTKAMATETRITLTIKGTVINAVLNDSKTAKDLLDRLPLTLQLQGYEFDFCGVMPEGLAYKESDATTGWKNGDIAFGPGANWFTILYGGEEQSGDSGPLVKFGRISDPLSRLDALPRSISVTLAKAD